MNALGLSMILKLGCICNEETIEVNGIKYRVKERLGEGGFAYVDLIENKSSKQRYVVKRMLCSTIEDQKMATEEMSYHKKFRHPNIVELIDSTFKGSADIVVNATSEAFLILPYYRRGTLRDYLQLRSVNKHYLDVTEILRMFMQICDAVKYMHDFKPDAIAHRDLSTGNVCLMEDMTPVLVDLGSCAPAKVQICGAQDAQKLQDLAAARCAMTYRAPELFRVESYCVIDQRTDIWSLGCVLYAMCYFKSPFDVVYERGDSVNLAVISGRIDFPKDAPFDEDMQNLILLMLRGQPQERPFIDEVIAATRQLRNKYENVA